MRSSSETEYESRASSRSARSCVTRVDRSNARIARSSRRSQPFSRASAAASSGCVAARAASARSRSRSVGAVSMSRGEGRERPAVGVPADVVLVEERRERHPRTGSPRAASPRPPTAWRTSTSRRRGLEHTVAKSSGPGWRRRDARAGRRGSRRRPARVSSSRNGSTRGRRGSDPCSRPRTKTTSNRRVRARARSSTATRPECRDGLSSHGDAIERGEHLVRAPLGPAPRDTSSSSSARDDRVVRAEIEAGALAGRRRRRAVRAPQHRRGELSDDRGRRAPSRTSEVERRQRASVAELGRDLDGAVAADDSPPAQTALDPVDLLPREPGVRRSKAARIARAARRRPRQSEGATGARAERRRAREPRGDSNDTGTPREANAVRAPGATASTDGHTTAISCGGVPARIVRERALRDQLERPARPCALEPADRAVERRAVGVVGEELSARGGPATPAGTRAPRGGSSTTAPPRATRGRRPSA